MNEKQFTKAVWAVKGLLVVVLLYVGFHAITARWQVGEILEPEAVSGDEQTGNEQADASQVRPSRDYAVIVQRDLFTGANRTTPQASPNRTQVLDALPSAEQLGLKLIGAIAGNPAASRAIIQNTQNNTISPYKVGDVVASATIESIQRDAVILRHQGRQLVLWLQPGASGDNSKGAAAKADEPRAAPAPPRPGAAVPLSTQAGYVEDVFRKVTIEPYVKNNRAQGLKISGLEKVPLAELFGLKNGDIIQTINGQQLTSKQKAFQVLMKAKSQSKVDIQLLRDGKNKDLSFEI